MRAGGQAPMRILVVDDHELVRKGICSLLASDPRLTVCGEAMDGREAVQKTKELHPDVVIMDISMPNMNGIEATRAIKSSDSDAEIVIVSQHSAPEMVRQAFNAGARGYVVKSSISRDLLEAIGKVAHQEPFVKVDGHTDQKSNLDAQEILKRSGEFENALRKSEERFRSAMNNMAEGLYMVDNHGLATYVNPSAEEMFGWSAAELLGKKAHDIIHHKRPDGSPFPASECPGLQVLEQGIELREHEDVFIRKDGSFFPVVLSASPMKSGSIVTGVVVSFRDDTKRREADAALRREVAAMNTLQEVSTRLGKDLDLRELVEMSLDAAIALTGAQRGNVQLLDSKSGSLRIFVQRGFQRAFLDFFDSVCDDASSACGAAMQAGKRIVVEDVRTSPVFAGTPALQIMLAANSRAVQSTPLVTRSGRLVGMLSTHFDAPHRVAPNEIQLLDVLARQTADSIERFESKNQLRQTSAQLQLVTDSMAVAMTHCSRDLRYLWINPRYASWIDRPAEEVVGHSIVEVLGTEATEKLRPYIEKVLGGEPASYEEQLNFKGIGHRWISASYVPTFDSAGRADGWVACIFDVTDRKQKQAEIARQARLLDFSFNAVLVFDPAGPITYWNKGAEELYGWTREEAVGQMSHTLLRTEFPEPLGTILARLRRDERWQGELIHSRKDGSRLTVLSRWQLTRDSETNSESIMEINIDITKTKEAERQLQLSVQTLEARIAERTQQLQTASEKLRELSVKLLQTQDEERRRIARELHDGVGQLLAAMSMNISLLDTERSKLSPESVKAVDANLKLIEDAGQEIRTMSHLLHPPLLDEVGLDSALRWYVDGFAERSKISVDLQLSPGFSKGLPRDFALSLFRIVQECLTNIHRHSGSLSAFVAVERSANQITLTVNDQGRGIAPDLQSRIASGESSGVGFRGMRERIRQFGGRLEVSSDENGTRVLTILPFSAVIGQLEEEANRDVPAGDAATDGIATEQPAPEAATILCIDDETAGLLPRQLLLESAGYRVIVARSGLEGIRLFQSEKVDAVILDYWMSGMKGTQVAAELKRINPGVPIIVLSGMLDLPGEAAGLVDEWIIKGSTRAEQLLNSINTLLEQRRE
jgi:PAS domain S-box-containing protein